MPNERPIQHHISFSDRTRGVLRDQRTIILIGPEGVWSERAWEVMGATKACVVRFGLFVLWVELAARVASAIVLSKSFELQGETP